MIKFIGLTGPTGAGKGAAAKILSDMGFYHLDCDKIYHELLVPPSPCLDGIRECFGDSVFTEDGQLDRKALADIVFSEAGRRDKLPILNSTTHKYVLDEILSRAEELSKKGHKVFIVDAPTLFESGFDSHCDIVISVLADKESRIERIIDRDMLPDRSLAEARADSQPNDDFYKEKSDYIVYNNGDLSELERKLKKIAEEAGF